MAVSTTNAVSGPYVANGSTTAFPFTFKCLTAEEVRVTITVAAVETEESTSSYSVTLNTGGDGGTITFDVAPATGDVRIYSEPEFTQETGFASGQAFSPSVVNEALDRAAVRDQYILRKINALLDEFDTGIVGDIRSDLASTASGKGAWLVKWISALSGAVARWVGDRLRDTVHLTDFSGCDPTGATSSDSAFASATATGREIYIPAGTYTITPRAFSNMLSCKIRGAGRDVTKIILTSTGTALTFSNCQWLQISDMSIQATGTPQTLANAIGIQLDTGSSNCVIERVNFYGFSLDGLRLVGTSGSPLSGNTVRDCYFLGCGRYQLYNEYNADFTIDDNQFGSLGAYKAQIGCYLYHSSAGTYTKNKHWSNDIGLKVVSSSFNSFVDNRIEINNTQGAYFDTCTDLIFNSNRVYSNSVTTDGASDNIYFTGCSRIVFVGNNIFTWDASYSRWGVNFDTGCDELTVRSNIIRGFDSTNFGPIRFEGNIQRIDGDLALHFTATSVAAGATVYPSDGAVTAEGAAYRSLPRRYAVGKFYAATVAAPGGGQTFTYTLRKNGIDTAMVCTSSGGSSFAAAVTATAPQILFDSGDFVSPKLVTSAGAAVTDHRGYIVLVSY